MLESLLNKVACLKACDLVKKETTTQLLYCEYCEIFKNSLFMEHLHWLLLNKERVHVEPSVDNTNCIFQIFD